ncbi:MAG TPA: DUF1236 domain-containing protein [Hyphomicrobiaceae bacterium]|nr:DUF1236 domain-containing protein [Hyphomicrobiaceae bacterium]
MQRHNLLAGTAIALVMCAVPAIAQQKSDDKAGAAQTQSETKEQGSPQKGTSQRKAEPKSEQGSARGDSKEKGAQHKEQGKEKAAQSKEQSKEKGAQTQEKNGKGTAQAPTKEQDKKGSAQTTPREKEGKGTAQTPSKDKGTAQAPGKEQEKSGQAKDRTGRDNAQKEPKDGGKQKSTERSGSGERVQLSEQQRTNVHQTLIKESNLNRATNVNISISVGTRVPRSVRLAPLPATIISIVPAYRSYQYVVVHDEICIVDPNTYEIVEVITASGPGRTAGVESRGSQTALVLTEEEKAIVLRSVEGDRSSTLGLGTLTEGSSVPRGANVRTFPDTVVQQVPKLKDHKFFAAENRLAIVDTQGDKVQLVLEEKR